MKRPLNFWPSFAWGKVIAEVKDVKSLNGSKF